MQVGIANEPAATGPLTSSRGKLGDGVFLSFFFFFVCVRFKQLFRKQNIQKTTFLCTKSYYSTHFSIPLLSFADTTHLSNRHTRRSPRVALLSFHKIRSQLSESITKFSDARSDVTSCENSSLSPRMAGPKTLDTCDFTKPATSRSLSACRPEK